jgi:hypothetical protein
VQTLTKSRIFFDDAESCPFTIIGAGQKVFWINARIEVFKSEDTVNSVESHQNCDGEGIVQHGTSLWFGGISGKVVVE